MLKYKINVISQLKEKGYNTTIIMRGNIIPQASMQKIRHGEVVGIKTLERLCELLELQPGDIIEWVKDKK